MTNPHKIAFVFTLILLSLVQISFASKEKLPQEVINLMASREMRYHHFLWHNVRNLWNKLDSQTQNRIRQLGWAPPRPALRYDSNGSSFYLDDNNSGEDFLYKHRQMILQVRQILNKYNMRIDSFNTIPAPNDRYYPALPTYSIPGNQGLNEVIARWKSTDFYFQNIKPAEDKFKDPNYLRSVTLGQLGSQIEFTIHSWLHLRFSDKVSAVRPRSSDGMPDIDTKWDNPSYNWLGDTYAAHVNPMFWKIHGWVDDRIEDWRKANNIATIRWKGTWTGGPMSNINHLMHEDHNTNTRKLMMHDDSGMDVMQEVGRLLLKTGYCTYFCCKLEENEKTVKKEHKKKKEKKRTLKRCQKRK